MDNNYNDSSRYTSDKSKKSNKLKIFMVLFVLLVLIAGSSYAVWRYNYNGTSSNVISSTDLSFRFLESNNEIVSIDNAVPMSDDDGIKQEGTGNVFDFEVKSKVGATTDVKYVASLEKISVDSDKTALNDSDVKVYIEDFNGNTVLKPTKVSDLDGYKLFEKLHRHSKDNSEISTKYKLKVWLDSEVDVFSLENKQYKFKINVKTEQKEQDSNQSYKLVYDLDGGTGSIADSTFKVGESVTITSVVPTKEGYNFLGWSTKKNDSSVKYKAGDSVTFNDAYDGSVRLYALWESKGYKIKYDSNGGSGTISDSSYKVGESKKLTKNIFTKEGYTFIGWNTNKDANAVLYTDEQIVSDLGKTGETITLYAIWKVNTYTVKYDSNGGTGSMANVIYSYGESKKLTKNIFAKEGYTFVGWNTDKDASTALYTDEQEVSNLSKENDVVITLYAIWKVNTYTVKYDGNGGTGSIANVIYSYGESKKLTKNTFTKEGYTFVGWNTDKDASTALYTDEQEVSNLTSDNDEIIVLYAVWKVNTYTIKYDENGGTGSMANVIYSYGESKKLTKNTFTKEGYTFIGWNTDKDATGVLYTDEQEVSNIGKAGETITLYAIWKANVYIVKYNNNGGVGSVDDSLYVYGENKKLTKNVFTREGYTFIGWNTDKDASTALYTDEQEVGNLTKENNEVINLYAIWEKDVNYTIRYNANGGYLMESKSLVLTSEDNHWELNDGVYRSGNYHVSDSTSSIKSETFTLKSDGFIVFDWAVSSFSDYFDYLYYTIYKDGEALSDTGTSTKIGGYNSSDTESNLSYKTITKNLEAGSYVIEFTYKKDVLGSYGLDRGYVKNIKVSNFDATVPNSAISASNKKLAKNIYERANYDFLGWNKNKDSTTADYKDEAIVPNLTSVEGDTVDLYAIWKLKQYDVSVVVQNGTITDTAKKVVKHGSSLSFSGITGMTGYGDPRVTCTNGQSATLSNGVLTTGNITSDTVCTVKYSENPTVTVNVVNGRLADGEVASKKIEYGADVTFNVIPNDSTNVPIISCSGATYENNVLSLKNVRFNTTCNVEFASSRTVVYNDGTLIINEPVASRNDNITTHGSVVEEYVPLNDNNSYVFTSSALWWYWSNNIKSVEIGSEIQPLATDYWFKDLRELTTVSLNNLNTSNTISMKSMFENAGGKAESIVMAGLDNLNVSNVTSMNSMFKEFGYYYGSGPTNVSIGNLSSWNLGSVTDASSMFEEFAYYATSIDLNISSWSFGNNADISSMFKKTLYEITDLSLDLSNWDTSKVSNMSNMFNSTGYTATTWSIGDLSKWDVSNVTNMSNMFGEFTATIYGPSSSGAGYNAITFDIGDLSKWDVSKVTNMDSMFASAGHTASSFNIGDLSNWNTLNVTSFRAMLALVGSNVTTFDIGDLSKWETSNVIDMSYMFDEAAIKATTFNVGDFSGWDVSNVKNMRSMFYSFKKNVSTFNLDLSTWDVSNVTNMDAMFGLAGVKATAWSLTGLDNWNVSNVTDMAGMFGYYDIATVIIPENVNLINWNFSDLSKWDVSNVTNMNSMFFAFGYNAKNFKLDLSKWDVSNVEKMASMFKDSGTASDTWSIGDLSNWNVSKVTSMHSMFYNSGYLCSSVDLGDLSNWDTHSVTTMENMFDHFGYTATTFNIGKLSSWNTSNVTNMYYMFDHTGYKAKNFEIDVSDWDVSKVTNMDSMFNSAGYSATTWSIGNLSNWDMTSVTNVRFMLSNAADASTKTVSLGILNIYSDTNVWNFIDMHSNFNISIVIRGVPKLYEHSDSSSYTGMFTSGLFDKDVTSSSSKVNLYYINDATKAVVEKIISDSGPSGTYFKSNIYNKGLWSGN